MSIEHNAGISKLYAKLHTDVETINMLQNLIKQEYVSNSVYTQLYHRAKCNDINIFCEHFMIQWFHDMNIHELKVPIT